MSSKNLMILVVGVVVIALLAYFVLKGNSYPSTPVTQPSATSTPAVTGESSTSSSVEIKNFSFSPTSATIKAGTTVTWTNNDAVPHTITSDPDGSLFKSSTLNPGETFQFTFSTAGSFPYHCSIHSSMQGTVIVTR